MEKVIFSMPEDHSMFLAALSAVQGWRTQQRLQLENGAFEIDNVEFQTEESYKRKRLDTGQYLRLCTQIAESRRRLPSRDHELTIHLPDPAMNLFQPAFGKAQFVSDYAPRRGDWDLAYKFDPERTYQFAKTTEKHSAIAMGALLGVECSSLPDLSAIDLPEGDTIDVLVIPWDDGYKDIVRYLQDNKPELRFGLASPGLDTFGMVCRSDMVVGPQCAATYIASCFWKRVVELVPDTKYKRWLSKWDNPHYQMVYGSKFAPSTIWRAMETLWSRPRTIRPITAPTVKNKLDLRTSIAGMSIAMLPNVEDLM